MAKPKAGPVPKEALRYFKQKGVKPGFSYLDVWKQEHAKAFTVAKLMEKDLLDKVRGSIKGALERGESFQTWQGKVADVFDKSGWSAYGTEDNKPTRLRKIFETNMKVARAAGQWERIERTKRALPYLQYQLGPSEVHRTDHEQWDGLILPVDDPWWDEHMPPNGWGCKCHVRQLTRAEAVALGGVDEAPETTYVSWRNPKTGEIVKVPEGVDPGWDYNPGKSDGPEE